MKNNEVRQLLAMMSMTVMGVSTAFYIITMPMPLVEFLAVMAPFIGCVTWFFRKKDDV